MSGSANPILSRLMAELRARRPLLSPKFPSEHRVVWVTAGTMVWMWLLSTGCRWDACTMCDYGKGDVDPASMIESVRRGLALISEPVNVLVVSPSGSMLDDREVTLPARQQIYELMREVPGPGVIMVESRAETIQPPALDQMAAIFPDRTLGVEMGLESAHPGVRRCCINKSGELADVLRAVDLLRQRHFITSVNVAVGTTFLSPAEAIADAVQTVRWALERGATQVVLFPLHAAGEPRRRRILIDG